MNQLTKQEKLQAYRDVHIAIRRSFMSFICGELYRTLPDRVDYAGPQTILQCFPEILKYKPKGIEPTHLWWPQSPAGQKIRLRVLDKVIKELNAQPNEEHPNQS